MTKDMENGEGVALAAEAMTIVMAHPIEEAIEHLNPYMFDAGSPEELLLSLHARYQWPIAELASVLLAVQAVDGPSQVAEVVFEEPDDTMLPMQFHLDNGQLVRTPVKQTIVEVEVEAELPDSWNTNGPHTPEQIERRCQMAEDIGLYFSEGAAELMRTESPDRLFDAYDLIEPFKRYALSLQESKQLVENIDPRVELRDQRLEELGEILTADTGLETIKKGVKDEIARWFAGLLGELAVITPPPAPRFLRHITTPEVHDMRARDEAMIAEGSKQAQRELNRQARDAMTDLALYIHTTPDSAPNV